MLTNEAIVFLLSQFVRLTQWPQYGCPQPTLLSCLVRIPEKKDERQEFKFQASFIRKIINVICLLFDVNIRLPLCHKELGIVNVTVLVEVVIVQNRVNLLLKLFIRINVSVTRSTTVIMFYVQLNI